MVVGMKKSVPSSSGGINSEPSLVNVGMVTSISAIAMPMTIFLCPKDHWAAGS